MRPDTVALYMLGHSKRTLLLREDVDGLIVLAEPDYGGRPTWTAHRSVAIGWRSCWAVGEEREYLRHRSTTTCFRRDDVQAAVRARVFPMFVYSG
jgi:hypothetical protein